MPMVNQIKRNLTGGPMRKQFTLTCETLVDAQPLTTVAKTQSSDDATTPFLDDACRPRRNWQKSLTVADCNVTGKSP